APVGGLHGRGHPRRVRSQEIHHLPMKTIPAIFLAALALLPASCGGKKQSSNPDITPEVVKFYQETKNEKGGPLFSFKTPADLPPGLQWENGADEEEFGSPDAR